MGSSGYPWSVKEQKSDMLPATRVFFVPERRKKLQPDLRWSPPHAELQQLRLLRHFSHQLVSLNSRTAQEMSHDSLTKATWNLDTTTLQHQLDQLGNCAGCPRVASTGPFRETQGREESRTGARGSRRAVSNTDRRGLAVTSSSPSPLRN